MAVLIGLSEAVKGRIFKLDREESTIGRAADGNVVLDYPSVSGRHGVIFRKDKSYSMRDLRSTNGTRVNGRQISDSGLKAKDIIQFGEVEFMFDAEPGEVIEAVTFNDTARVEVADGPASVPTSFDSISPFGARRRENRILWNAIIIGFVVLALVAVVWLVLKLLNG